MSDPRREDWEILGLEPDASPEEVQRAFDARVELYRTDSLATYSLLSAAERATLVERVERAHRNLLGASAGSSEPAAAPATPTVLSPDPFAAPGAYLRHHREALGLDLATVTTRTKIRTPMLEALERERFDFLPAEVFVRGFVLQVARLLQLPDPETVSRCYLEKMAASRKQE